MELNQDELVGDDRSSNAQNQSSRQIKKLHARQGDSVVANLLIESFHFETPIISRNRSENFKRLFRLVVNACGVESDGKRSSYHIDQRNPKIERVGERRLVTEINFNYNFVSLVSNMSHSKLRNNWTQMKNKLFETESKMIFAKALSTVATSLVISR